MHIRKPLTIYVCCAGVVLALFKELNPDFQDTDPDAFSWGKVGFGALGIGLLCLGSSFWLSLWNVHSYRQNNPHHLVNHDSIPPEPHDHPNIGF